MIDPNPQYSVDALIKRVDELRYELHLAHQEIIALRMTKYPWERHGLFYKSLLIYTNEDGYLVRVYRKLDFIAYHLIKYYHGESKLIEMANKRL